MLHCDKSIYACSEKKGTCYCSEAVCSLLQRGGGDDQLTEVMFLSEYCFQKAAEGRGRLSCSVISLFFMSEKEKEDGKKKRF